MRLGERALPSTGSFIKCAQQPGQKPGSLELNLSLRVPGGRGPSSLPSQAIQQGAGPKVDWPIWDPAPQVVAQSTTHKASPCPGHFRPGWSWSPWATPTAQIPTVRPGLAPPLCVSLGSRKHHIQTSPPAPLPGHQASPLGGFYRYTKRLGSLLFPPYLQIIQHSGLSTPPAMQ